MILMTDYYGLSHRASLELTDFSAFHKITFRAYLQILAKSWWCTVCGERTGFLRR